MIKHLTESKHTQCHERNTPLIVNASDLKCVLPLLLLICIPGVGYSNNDEADDMGDGKGIISAVRSTPLSSSPPTIAESLARLGNDNQLESPVVDKPDLRWWWFWNERTSADGEIPKGAMYRARQQQAIFLNKSSKSRILFNSPPDTWLQIGRFPPQPNPTHSSGRIRSIAIDTPSTIYVGTASGGVWKTTNSGLRWEPLTDDQPSLTQGSVAIDTSNSDIVYVGTGEYSGYGPAPYGAGLLKTTNAGTTWKHIAGPWYSNQGGASIGKVIVVPGGDPKNSEDDVVLVASTRGLFRSTKGATDFASDTKPVFPLDSSDIIVDPNNNSLMYVAVHGRGVWRSTDSGQNWASIWTPPQTPSASATPTSACKVYRGQLALAPTNSDVLYVAFEARRNECGTVTDGMILKSINVTSKTPSFVILPTPAKDVHKWCDRQCGYDLSLIVQPIDPDGETGPLKAEEVVYTGAVPFYRSTDGGLSWTMLDVHHTDIQTLSFDTNGALYIGSDGGIWRNKKPATSNSETDWSNLNANLAITQFNSGVALHPSADLSQSQLMGSTLLLGGAQDNGNWKYSVNGDWQQISGRDGNATVFDFINPEKKYFISTHSLDILKTTDGGKSFNRKVSGIVKSGAPFYYPMAMCPNNVNILIVSADKGIYRTISGADNWSDNSFDFGTHWHEAPTALVFAHSSNCMTYFAGGRTDRNGIKTPYLYRTTSNGGTNPSDWTLISNGFPNRSLTDIAIHPTDRNTLIVTLSGFCGDTASCTTNDGHVWMTSNALADDVTWTELTGGKGFPNVPVNSVTFDPVADPAHIVIGTDLGVYRSTDTGKTWHFEQGLPNVPVTDLVLNNDTGIFVAATFGRGMFMKTRTGNCSWHKVGPQKSHNASQSWCPNGSYLTQLDLDRDYGLNEYDAPIVGQVRCCGLRQPASNTYTSCSWQVVGGMKTHKPGQAWCPTGSFLTQIDFDSDRLADPKDSPIVGKAQCCSTSSNNNNSYGACSWEKVGPYKSHSSTEPWCSPGSFLTQMDFDAGKQISSYDAPIVGQARCCEPKY